MLDIIAAAFAGGQVYKDARRELLRRAKGERESEVVLATDADLQKWTRGL